MLRWLTRNLRKISLSAASVACLGTAFAQPVSVPFKPVIPKTWDEKALADWATPVAGLNARPGHYSEEEYYRAPVQNYRSYPIYMPGREPDGYWEMLQKVGPKPIFEPKDLRSKADWIEAGRLVFEQADHFTQRSRDPKVIASFRSAETFAQATVLADGTVVGGFRWVPTGRGVEVGLTNCGSCHTRYGRDGARMNGPPTGGSGFGNPFFAAASGTTLRPLLFACRELRR